MNIQKKNSHHPAVTSPSRNVFQKLVSNQILYFLIFFFFLVRFKNFYHVKVSSLPQKIESDGKMYKVQSCKDD